MRVPNPPPLPLCWIGGRRQSDRDAALRQAWDSQAKWCLRGLVKGIFQCSGRPLPWCWFGEGLVLHQGQYITIVGGLMVDPFEARMHAYSSWVICALGSDFNDVVLHPKGKKDDSS